MPEQWTRSQVMEMGLVAMQAGVESPEHLMDLIRKACQVEWRIPMALHALREAQLSLQRLGD